MQAGPSRTGALLLLSSGLALGAGALLVDPVGRVLVVPAAVLLLALGGRDLVLSPVLTADGTGLSVVDGWRRLGATWPEVERLRLVTDRRTPLLEVDLGEAVVVLSRRRLGRPPYAVLDELEAVRSGGVP